MFRDKCPLTFYGYKNDYNDFLIIRFLWQLSNGDVYACILHLLNHGMGHYSIKKRTYIIISFEGMVTDEIVDHMDEGIVLMNNDFTFSPEAIQQLESENVFVPVLSEETILSLIDSGDFDFVHADDLEW